jgi:hypothetical protein
MDLLLAFEKVMTTWTPLPALATKELSSLLVGGNFLPHLLVRGKSNLLFILFEDAISVLSLNENKLFVLIETFLISRNISFWKLYCIDLRLILKKNVLCLVLWDHLVQLP